jgi:hypothetical protein
MQQITMIYGFSLEARRSGIKVERCCIKNSYSKNILDGDVSYQSIESERGRGIISAWMSIVIELT